MKLSALLRLEKFYILLLVELLFILVLPLAEPNTMASKALTAIGLSLILLAAFNSLEEKKKLKRASLLVVFVFVLLTVLFQVNQHPVIYLFSFLLFLFLLISADYSIMKSLIRAKEIKASSVAGSLAGYLMIGISFAFFIVNVGLIYAEPLSKKISELGFSGVMYYSLATMTTIGYGDIVATMPLVQITSALIAVISQFYIAVVVAIIIGKLMNPKAQA